jgi:hypothetical protein
VKVNISNELSDIIFLKVKDYRKRVAALNLMNSGIEIGVDVFHLLDAENWTEPLRISEVWVVKPNKKICVYPAEKVKQPIINCDHRIASYLSRKKQANLVFTNYYKVM